MKPDIKTLLERGTVDVIVKEELEAKLKSGKKLRVKFGIDPTGSELHLGHAVVLKKLRQFQDAGHQAVLVIGDYTGRIGDPTGRSETRVMLTEKEIKENMKTYIAQASKILDTKKLEIRYNSEWFGKMTMAQILELTSKKTVHQILQREDFKNRFKNEEDICATELLYPLMQGYDSVMLESDVEMGGRDQIFNMLVGRDLQKRYNKKMMQDVMTLEILEGTDGVEKMSKSFGNYVGIMEPAKEIYGKILSIPDTLILKYFELTTDISSQELENIKKSMSQGENPKNLKMRLARELVTFYHDKKSAEQAEKEFQEVFANKGLPDKIDLKKLPNVEYNIVDLITETGLTDSKGEAKRLIDGGAVKIDNQKITSKDDQIDIKTEKLLQVGKRKFIKVIGK